MSFGPLIGIAALKGEERRCLKTLKKLKATSPKNAVDAYTISTEANLPIHRTLSALQRLIQQGKVQKEDEKYFAVG